MRRVRIRRRYRTESFGGWGGFLGGSLGSRLGSRLGEILGKRFGRKMADTYLPGLLLKLGTALLPGLPFIFMKNRK